MNHDLFHQGLVLLSLICYGITTLRLIIYQPGTGLYNIPFSEWVWYLMLCTGTRTVSIFLNLNDISVTIDEAGIALLLCILVWRAKGNVAKIMRGES